MKLCKGNCGRIISYGDYCEECMKKLSLRKRVEEELKKEIL